MAESRTKLARALSDEELQAFLEDLRALPDLTGAKLRELAAGRGITIGHNSANEFLRKEFEPYCAKIARSKDLALYIAEHAQPGAASTIADAAAAHLSQEVFEFLVQSDTNLNLFDEGGIEKANNLALIISRIRQGDVRRDALQLKVKELEREAKDREDKIKKALKSDDGRQGLSVEARKAIRETLGMTDDE